MEQKNLNDVWKRILSDCQVSDNQKLSLDFMGPDTKLANIEEEQGRLIIVVKSDFVKAIFENEFYIPLVESANIVLNSNFNILFLSENEWKIKKNPSNQETTQEIVSSSQKSFETNSLNPKMNFENFVISNNNKMLIQAAMAVSATLGSMKWNPFFIYGGSGLGKTHLLHAVGNKTKQTNSSTKIKYFEARDFGELIHNAIVGNSISIDFEEIKQEYLGYDLLLVDDIQMIQSWTKVKEIFFTIFSAFINEGKQVIITSDQYIDELKDFEERFITRFQGGLSINIVPPDVEASKKIVQMKLKDNHSFNTDKISDEAVEFVATHFGANVRELEGAVNRIIFWTIQYDNNKEIKMAEITDIFEGMTSGKRRGITVNRIITTVSKFYGVSSTEVKGNSRKAEIMLARHVSIYFVRTLLNLSVINIGKEFARDHSTILSSINKIKKELEKDSDLSKAIYDLRKKITEGE